LAWKSAKVIMPVFIALDDGRNRAKANTSPGPHERRYGHEATPEPQQTVASSVSFFNKATLYDNEHTGEKQWPKNATPVMTAFAHLISSPIYRWRPIQK
jgi:hypothetical protein